MIPNPGAAVATQESTGFERALADVEAEILMQLHAEVVIETWDPWLISERNLPYLAYAHGVNLWEEVWSLTTKRQWVDDQFTFQSLRGSIDGFKMALEVNGFDLVEWVAPPGGFYVSPDLPKDEFDAWIRLMPQIRIKLAERIVYPMGDEFFIEDGFIDVHGIGEDDGEALYGRQAVIRWRDGTEEDLRIVRRETVRGLRRTLDWEDVHVPGLSTMGFVIGEDYLVPESEAEEEWRFIDAGEREAEIIRVQLDQSYQHEHSQLHLSTVQHGLVPLRPEYERMSDVRNGGPFFHVGVDFISDDDTDWGYIGDGQEAGEMIADVLYLFDPVVAAPLTEGFSYIGVDRIGVAPFTLELLVDLKGKSTQDEWLVGETYLGEGYLDKDEREDVDRALRAVVAAKAKRDKVLVSFAPWRFVEAGDIISEETTVGTHVRDVL